VRQLAVNRHARHRDQVQPRVFQLALQQIGDLHADVLRDAFLANGGRHGKGWMMKDE
jgi:hypothetical protein